MSLNFCTEQVCDTYRWLLQMGCDQGYGTLFTGRGSAAPMELSNSDVLTLSGFVPSYQTTIIGSLSTPGFTTKPKPLINQEDVFTLSDTTAGSYSIYYCNNRQSLSVSGCTMCSAFNSAGVIQNHAVYGACNSTLARDTRAYDLINSFEGPRVPSGNYTYNSRNTFTFFSCTALPHIDSTVVSDHIAISSSSILHFSQVVGACNSFNSGCYAVNSSGWFTSCPGRNSFSGIGRIDGYSINSFNHQANTSTKDMINSSAITSLNMQSAYNSTVLGVCKSYTVNNITNSSIIADIAILENHYNIHHSFINGTAENFSWNSTFFCTGVNASTDTVFVAGGMITSTYNSKSYQSVPASYGCYAAGSRYAGGNQSHAYSPYANNIICPDTTHNSVILYSRCTYCLCGNSQNTVIQSSGPTVNVGPDSFNVAGTTICATGSATAALYTTVAQLSACHTYMNNIVIKNIPTSSAGLPTGHLWRCTADNTLRIVV